MGILQNVNRKNNVYGDNVEIIAPSEIYKLSFRCLFCIQGPNHSVTIITGQIVNENVSLLFSDELDNKQCDILPPAEVRGRLDSYDKD
jgi:hypothetical protein